MFFKDYKHSLNITKIVKYVANATKGLEIR